MPHTRGLVHVNLNVTDVDRSARFYSQVLGMKIHSDTTETVARRTATRLSCVRPC